MNIFRKIESLNDKKIYILGIQIYKKYVKNNITIKKYLSGLIVNKQSRYFHKIYFLGIKIYSKKNPMKELQDFISYKMDKIFYNMQILNQIPIVHKYFGQYKRIHENKSVVICACGPTIKYYNYKNNNIHLGINGAIRLYDKFNYLFLTDKFVQDTSLNEEIDNYKGDNCEKFYAVLPQKRLMNPNKGIDSNRIPQINIYNSNANIFLLEDVYENKWAVNLQTEAFGDFGGTIFSALQFVLYTHPQKIYLVGCDCSIGYAYSSNINYDYAHQIRHYQMFKKFVQNIYPDVEIISINPVGLKGMFKDVYTQSYLDANPELKEELGNNIEIIEEECV